MNKNNNWIMFAIITLGIILISITMFALKKEKEELLSKEPEKIYVGVEGLNTVQKTNAIESLMKLTEDIKEDSGYNNETINSLESIISNMQKDNKKLDNFNRESAVNKLKELIISVGEDPNKTVSNNDDSKKTNDDLTNKSDEIDSVISRLEMLNKEETDIEDVLTQNTIDLIYFANDFGNDKFNRQFAASSMLIYHDLIRSSTETKDFNPVIQTYDDIVYLDNKFMTAHIPLDIFLGTGTGIAFEMQYIDNDWKLNPYSAMMSLNLMGLLNSDINVDEDIN
ncbi:MAG TPA: hypothetical protein GXZ90_01415 [Clostridiales bacterium]|nr:hypothetical protein [Clostridiales bacterium]